MKTHRYCFLALCLLALTGTVTQVTAQAPAQPPQANRPADAPTPSKLSDDTKPMAAVDPATFQIGAEDIIAIQVWREPDFSRQVMVRPDGKITLPLIAEVQASGLTPDQLAKALTDSLSKYLNNPQVVVTVLQVNSKKFFITGEVQKPGPYPLVVPTRVLEAISGAGGFRDFANQKNIVILRKGQRIKFNYKDVIKGKNTEQNIFVENGDYIIVP